MEMTISEIVDTLTEEQKRQLYYLVGSALEDRKDPRGRKTEYRDLVKPLEEIQKKCVDSLIDEALKESKKGKKND